jgi:small subunit ribosomal protein S16
MAVVLRLMRMGSNQSPYFRLVATDSRKRRQGRFLEQLGDYNPKGDSKNARLKADRIVHWLNQGAVPSERVGSILRKNGIARRAQKATAGTASAQKS